MQHTLVKYSNYALLGILLCAVCAGLLFNACEEEEESDEIVLFSWGPSPALRGGDLKFIGQNLDKVTSVLLPDSVAGSISTIEVNTFKTKTPPLLVITVPEEADAGYVTLKTHQGDIVTKTLLGIAEPISIDTIYPLNVRPGDIITIEGDFLYLIKSVIFSTNKVDTVFVSQSKTKIEATVPEDAQTGVVTLSNGAVEPILVESAYPLNVALPLVTALSPNPVKAGSQLTIAGTDLDLAKKIVFGGEKQVTGFVSQTATEMVVSVPAAARDGKIKLIPASGVESEFDTVLIMAVPVISQVTPNPAKTGSNVTVTGTDLDLITSVVFGGNTTGELQSGGTASQITVSVPETAIPGMITFNTAANKSVVYTAILGLVQPVITNITPLVLNTKETITITGTDLDIVDTVKFTGDRAVEASGATSTQLTVMVPPGSQSGTITLVATNGDLVVSTQSLTLTPADAPVITDMPSFAAPGSVLTIRGSQLDLFSEIIFPGNVTATMYGIKTDTMLQVYIPTNVQQGKGNITFITYENEVIESPDITIIGIEPIVDPSLIINDFDETGHDLGWDNWGSNVELGNDPAISITGKYMHGTNQALSGWAWIWGCNHPELPKVALDPVDDYYFKFELYIATPLAPSAFQMEFEGYRVDLGPLGIKNANGTYSTAGWITVTYDMASFTSLPATFSGDDTKEWGLNMSSGTDVDLTGLYMDNFRFQHK
ncbi:MAG: IPT/TIG domain-containing protein [Bacteroidales bacterium]|nr:IPT/TIG domain-containing protein [Bacteroidales bacterium]